MKVLWITNILFPEASALLNDTKQLKGSGGWLIGGAYALADSNDNIELAIATVSRNVKELRCLEGNKMLFYILPYGKGNLKVNDEYGKYWKKIKSTFNPDIIHIHGTEYSHGLSYIKACGNDKVVLSIQGLKSEIHKYYLAGISTYKAIMNITLRDIINGTLLGSKSRFRKQGYYEKEMIANVNHIIGRTTWDRAQTWAIHPKASYYNCNETLQAVYYNGEKWEYDKCHKHTIFLSQSGYPLKGLHIVLEALVLVLKYYPNARIRIAGYDITRSKEGLKGLVLISGYGLYLKKIIHKYNLQHNVEFIGNLDAKQMKDEYLKCNLFICPSSLENSPNSLGEAQVLGTPVIASYVGGIPDMMVGYEDFLYRFDDINTLAYKICKCFELGCKFTSIEKDKALNRHNPENNKKQLISIYKAILQSK